VTQDEVNPKNDCIKRAHIAVLHSPPTSADKSGNVRKPGEVDSSNICSQAGGETVWYQKHLFIQQEGTRMTTGTHRCLDLTASHWVTCVLIGRADQMPTELVSSLGRQQTKKPMLYSKHNCCGAKKEVWSLPRGGSERSLDEIVDVLVANA
jgi:hypothetical protein